MACRKPLRVIPRKPDMSVLVLPGQCLERQVDANLLAFGHQRRTAPRVTEDQQFRGTQVQPGLACASRVVDPGEHQQPGRIRCSRQAIDRHGNRKPAWANVADTALVKQAVNGHVRTYRRLVCRFSIEMFSKDRSGGCSPPKRKAPPTSGSAS